MGTITIFTDGGARGNPGPSGAGAVIYGADGKELKKVSKFLGTQTNNWAEYEAVALALQEMKKLFGAQKLKDLPIEVFLDSQLVARQLSNEYQVKEPTLFPQFIKVHNMLVKDMPHTTFHHVPREKNKEADRLANEAMDGGAHTR